MDKTMQGDIGVAAATLHYRILGGVVMTPNTERVKYDLVVDLNGEILRVQVKSTGYERNGKYTVQLRTNGANYTTKNKHSKISSEEADVLFVVTREGKCYHIPAKEISGMSEITLGTKYEQYWVRTFGALWVVKD